MKMRHGISLLFALVIAATGLSGCHTTEGFGKDMQKAGQSIEHKAQEEREH